jgi:hypothetical protein
VEVNAAVDELKQRWVGHTFDTVHFEVDAESLVEFAAACGETLPRYTDPADPDFQAVPSYTARYHGGRALPEGFPMRMEQSFDGGKCVEWHGAIRPGDRLTARSKIHDVYEKSGRSGGMRFVVHRMEFSNQRDELVSVVDWKMIQKLG